VPPLLKARTHAPSRPSIPWCTPQVDLLKRLGWVLRVDFCTELVPCKNLLFPAVLSGDPALPPLLRARSQGGDASASPHSPSSPTSRDSGSWDQGPRYSCSSSPALAWQPPPCPACAHPLLLVRPPMRQASAASRQAQQAQQEQQEAPVSALLVQQAAVPAVIAGQRLQLQVLCATLVGYADALAAANAAYLSRSRGADGSHLAKRPRQA
jgi:hypothetical protein